MTTFNVALGDLDGPRLQALVDAGLREGRQFEFKQELPGGSDDERRKFLGTVSSFANAAGGDVIYGISDRRDGTGQATGEADRVVGLSGVNIGVETLRLEDVIRTGVDPRLVVQLREIRRDPEPSCLLIRVPRSWSGLHMITFKDWNRFYSRNAAGKFMMDVRQIAQGFLAAASARQRAGTFRAERIGRVISGETPIRLGDQPKTIVHAIPLDVDNRAWATFQAGKGETVARAFSKALQDVLVNALGSFDWSWAYNLDGFLVRSNVRRSEYDSYVLLFRDGTLEAVLVEDLMLREVSGRLVFSGTEVESIVLTVMHELQKVWRELAIAGPVAIGVTVAGLPVGAGMVLDNATRGLPAGSIDRDPLVLPEIVADDLDVAPQAMLRPIFDVLWNTGGLARSPNYEGDVWTRR